MTSKTTPKKPMASIKAPANKVTRTFAPGALEKKLQKLVIEELKDHEYKVNDWDKTQIQLFNDLKSAGLVRQSDTMIGVKYYAVTPKGRQSIFKDLK